MAAKHSLHVALTEPLVRHVREQVTAGRYVNVSEAVRRALQLLIDQEGTETNHTVSASRKTLGQSHA